MIYIFEVEVWSFSYSFASYKGNQILILGGDDVILCFVGVNEEKRGSSSFSYQK